MEFLVTGGIPYTVPILLMGLTSVILIGLAAVRVVKKQGVSDRLCDVVLFLGFLSLAWGIFGQIIGMFQAAGSVMRAGEISPSLIWAGLRVSMITVIMGFVVLLVSGIGWFLLRPYRNR